MTSLLPILAALTLVQSGPRLEVLDTHQCINSDALGAALEEGLPAPWAAMGERLLLALEVSAGPDGQAASLRVALSVETADAASLEREMAIIPDDCASLARLVAVIVGRHLSELPQDAWPAVASPPPPPPVEPMPGAVAGPTPPTREAAPVTANLTVRLGVETGPDADLWGGAAGVDAIVSAAFGYAMLFGVDVLAYAPIAVGDGSAQLTTVLGRLGPAWELPWQSVTVSFATGLGAGVTIAQGRGFERDLTTVGSAVRGWVSAGVRTTWGLGVTVGGAVVFVRPQLSAPGTGEDGVAGSAARLRLSVGYTFGD